MAITVTACMMMACVSVSDDPKTESGTNGNVLEQDTIEESDVMVLLDEQMLRECLEENGTVALVEVKDAEIQRAGTRGEQVKIKVVVTDTLLYNPGKEITLERYTGKGNTVLQIGKKYLVAIIESDPDLDLFHLHGFCEVPDGREKLYMEKTRDAIKKISD